MATKRLKELLEARKPSPRDNSVYSNGHLQSGQMNEKSLQKWLEHELEVMVNVHEVRDEFDKQTQVYVFNTFVFLQFCVGTIYYVISCLFLLLIGISFQTSCTRGRVGFTERSRSVFR